MPDDIDDLVRAIEAFPDPALTETARRLVQALLRLHRTGLEKIMEIADDGLRRRLAADSRVEALLLLHGLHPEDLESRVARAIEKVRPALQSHGGNVELVGIEEGRIRLRLQGSCDGCPSSAATLRGTLEEAILAAAPDAEGIEVV